MRPSLPYKIISHVWAFLSLALVCMGCVKDIEIDSKMNQQSKITLYGVLEADSIPKLLILKTSGSKGYQTYSPGDNLFVLKSAEVLFFVNGKEVDRQTLSRNQNELKDEYHIFGSESMRGQRPLFYKGSGQLRPGDVVRIVVRSDGLQDAVVEEAIPQRAQCEYISAQIRIDEQKYFADYHLEGDKDKGYKYIDYLLSYEDPSPRENYFYGLLFRSNDALTDNEKALAGHRPIVGFGPAQKRISPLRGRGDRPTPLWIGFDPTFSKNCVDFFRGVYRRPYSLSIHQIAIPYFSNYGLKVGKRILRLMAPHGEDPSNPSRKLYLYTLSRTYFRFASHSYGRRDLAEGETGDLSSSLTPGDDSPVGERIPTLSNVEGGTGLVLARTATVVEVPIVIDPLKSL